MERHGATPAPRSNMNPPAAYLSSSTGPQPAGFSPCGARYRRSSPRGQTCLWVSTAIRLPSQVRLYGSAPQTAVAAGCSPPRPSWRFVIPGPRLRSLVVDACVRIEEEHEERNAAADVVA
jgi:hypothetical protein